MGKQKAADRAGTKPRGGKFGGVTSSASKGMPINASANNARGNNKMNKGGTRPITNGTK